MSTDPFNDKKTSNKDHASKAATFIFLSFIFVLFVFIGNVIITLLNNQGIFSKSLGDLISGLFNAFVIACGLLVGLLQLVSSHFLDGLGILTAPTKRRFSFRKYVNTRRTVLLVCSGIGVGVSLTLAVLRLLKWLSTFEQVPPQTPQEHPSPLSVVLKNDDPLGSGPQWIGISQGQFAFDTYADRPGANLKREATNAWNSSDTTYFTNLLRQAIQQDSNDAEALIYLENQQVLDSGKPYITFVIVTMLSGTPNSYNVGRDNLQGAYVAQKECNAQNKLPGNTQVRLLIANVGDQSEYALWVKDQIVQLAQDETQALVGIMGWPSQQGDVGNAIKQLGQTFLPMISPTAADDTLSGISQYFFRVCPSNIEQVKVAAQYAKQHLGATRASIIYDPGNENSLNLANDFQVQFNDSTHRIIDKESYTLGEPEALADYVQATLRGEPDLIYFAGGYPNDVGVVLKALPPSGINVFGADTLYQASHYSDSTRASDGRLYFTAFAFPDTWQHLKLEIPPFFKEYRDAFDPLSIHNHPGMNPYGFIRPDNDVMLSYDALSTLLDASKIMLASYKTNGSPQDLQQDLEGKKGSQKLQQILKQMKAREGVSGLIFFDGNGNVENKAVVVLQIDVHGSTQLKELQGKFL